MSVKKESEPAGGVEADIDYEEPSELDELLAESPSEPLSTKESIPSRFSQDAPDPDDEIPF